MTQQPDTSGLSLMLHELREDPGDDEELERVALSRVRERLAISLTSQGMHDAALEDYERAPQALVATRQRSKWRWGARSGALAALAVGTALGASGHAIVSLIVERAAPAPKTQVVQPATPPLHAPQPAKFSQAAPPPAPEPGAIPLDESSPSPPRARLQKAVTTAPAVEGGFDPELRELEVARRAVATNPSQALAALRLHGQRYPRSVLSQEREALTVKALVAAGRQAEARAAAASFGQRYPDSMLLDSVQNAIRSIP